MSKNILNQIKQWAIDENAAEEQSKKDFFNDLFAKTGVQLFPKTKKDALALYDHSKQNSASASLLLAAVGITALKGKEATQPTSIPPQLDEIPHSIHNQIKQWSKDESKLEELRKVEFFTDLLTKTGVALFPKSNKEALHLYDESTINSLTSTCQLMTLENVKKAPNKQQVMVSAAQARPSAPVPHYILNQIKQWSTDENIAEQQSKIQFLEELLAKNGVHIFPKTKAEALALYETSKLDKAGTKLRAAMHVPDHSPVAASKTKADALLPQISAAKVSYSMLYNDSKPTAAESEPDSKYSRKVTVTTTVAKAEGNGMASTTSVQERNSGKAPTTAAERERRQRRNGEPVSYPTVRSSPIRVYCGGGKYCGYQVPYIPGEPLPAYCDGHREKQAAATKTRRVNHQCNWEDIVCVHNRCEINSSHLISALVYGCCPNCRLELHGGVITHFGLVLH